VCRPPIREFPTATALGKCLLLSKSSAIERFSQRSQRGIRFMDESRYNAIHGRSPPATEKADRRGQVSSRKRFMKPDDKLCYCFHVTQRKITNFIRIHQPRVPSEVSECGGAGTGCGWCVPFLKKLFDAAAADREPQIDITPEAYENQRLEYVRSGKGKPPTSNRS